MKILAIDVGTGTQDILIYDDEKELENSIKLVLPSPHLYISQQIKEIENISTNIIESNSKDHYIDFNQIRSEIRDKVGKYLYQETECKPMILSVIQEI